MIVANNYEECVDNHLDIKVNFLLDILEGCIHNCSGCYVNRRGNKVATELFRDLLGIQNLFNENDLRFSSITIGPTDIFGASNSHSLLDDKNFQNVVSNCTTVEMVSTLEKVDYDLIEKFNAIKKKTDFMYGFQIAIDPRNYSILDLKDKIKVLDSFSDPINFYIVFNMDYGDIDVDAISIEMKEELGAFVEFLPSYQRVKSGEIHKKLISEWKSVLSDYDSSNRKVMSMTIRDKQQGGPYELNYSLHKGEFYSVPFVYDNAIISAEKFRVKDIHSIDSWVDIKTDLYLDGLSYLPDTQSCHSCRRSEVCLNKHVLNYMKHYGIEECVYPDWIKDDY